MIGAYPEPPFGRQASSDGHLMPLLEGPDRRVVRHTVTGTQTYESEEAETVSQLKWALRFCRLPRLRDPRYHLLVSKVVEALENQHLEHQNRAPRWATPLRLVLIGMVFQEDRTETLPVNDSKPLKAGLAGSHRVHVAENVEDVALLASGLHAHVSGLRDRTLRGEVNRSALWAKDMPEQEQRAMHAIAK